MMLSPCFRGMDPIGTRTMRTVLNETAKALFVERFAVGQADFSHVKSRKTFLPGAAAFELKLSRERTGWIAFGGFKDSCFAVAAGWTVSGLNPTSLEEWDRHPTTFSSCPPPTNGWVDLRDRWRFEPKSGEPYVDLDLPEPSEDLQGNIFSAYVDTPAFEQQVDRAHRGAMLICKKNPPTLEQTRAHTLKAERVLYKLWGHLLDRHEFTAAELVPVLEPVVTRAVAIAAAFGVPLVRERLASEC